MKSVLALVVDEPSSRLYSSSADATVRAWDLTNMSCVAVIRSHSKPVTKLQLLGGRLLFTAAGGAVRVWDTSTFVCLAKVRTSYYSGAIRSMLVSVEARHAPRTHMSEQPSFEDARPLGETLRRNSTDKEGCTNHLFNHIFMQQAQRKQGACLPDIVGCAVATHGNDCAFACAWTFVVRMASTTRSVQSPWVRADSVVVWHAAGHSRWDSVRWAPGHDSQEVLAHGRI
jgi:hypothetical protein